MYKLNHRIGILFRQNISQKSYELRYFFIDDEGNLFRVLSLPRLQKIIRLSQNFKEIRNKLIDLGEQSFSLKKWMISKPKAFNTEVILPFSNRSFIDLKQRQDPIEKQEKSEQLYRNEKIQGMYRMFGLSDDDTLYLYNEILHLTGLKKMPVQYKQSQSDQQQKLQQNTQKFFKHYIQIQQKFKMKYIDKGEIEFQCNLENKEIDGKCVEILKNDGITFTGMFHQGVKWGEGLLVNETLDSFKCEFIDDQLVGI